MKFLKFLFWVVVIAAGVAVAASIASKKKFAGMSDDEIRAFLADKLDGKVAADQLKSIQDAVIAGVRASGKAAPMADEDDKSDTSAAVEADSADEAADKVSEVIVDVVDA